MPPTIKPFKISVPDSQLQQLNKKLDLATFPDELQGAGWDLGAPLADIKRLTEYWRDGFVWREQERQLNESMPEQFIAEGIEVDGFGKLDVHFVHRRSEVEGAIPLVFVHGWPGSFIEAKKLLPLLTKGAEDGSHPSFHVVAPSLPNFGFSGGVGKKGFGLKQYAQTVHALMTALGYDQYVSQGGDWGAMISRLLGQLFPDHVKAIHINLVATYPPWPWKHPILFFQALGGAIFGNDISKIMYSKKYGKEGSGYLIEQDSKPQTIGYALHDSPVALLSWVYEKLHDWTDEYPWTDDEILTWISIYVFSTAGPAASVRIYHESTHPPTGGITRNQSLFNYLPKVKIGLAYFPREIVTLPLSWGRTMGNVVRQTEFESGGHFAAWEEPEALAGDLRGMFRKEKGEAYGVVQGSSGY
ncbi:hypothetical protein FQN54_002972 [Arachnomyces sp. PD_36]|nr:hypothetical protein FQN54_002972 [Arachnomyces sp. PD_36]